MSMTRMSQSRTFPIAVAEAFDRLLPMPLSDLFASWYGPIPPIRATVQEGEWGTPGQERAVVFAGPGGVRETLIQVDRPRVFSYELSEPTGPLATLIARVEGRWMFEPAGTGVRITWSWDVHPRNRMAGVALPVFARLWKGYAKAALTRLEGLLLSSREPG
jgi:hypothetical protein